MIFSEFSHFSQLPASARWLLFVDLACLTGILAALWSGVRHFMAARGPQGPRDDGRPSWADRIAPIWVLGACVGLASISIWNRYVEVNHFPSQTMSEVVVMFSGVLLLSLFILHFALGLHRRAGGWAILDDALLLIVFCAVPIIHHYARSLTTMQRDLPPALQSYWFAPHLSSLMLSYATLGIAGVICLVYFVTRFWTGVFVGGRSKTSQILIALGLILVPFAHFVTLPVFCLGGIVFWILMSKGKLPDSAALARIERDFDDVSFRAFAVGMPFLTLGLWMGAFWAQEAWANYWGWDSKENSALISWLIYVVYIHLRMLGGYRGEKAMGVLMGGALSIFITFQLFGYLPDSQKNSLHKYTDDGVVPTEGMQGPPPATESARAEPPAGSEVER